MALTPVEIRHIRLRKALFGYQTRQTDELLTDVVASFEDVWRDRADLADKIEQLEGELVRYRELEQLLRTTLISAERASQQMTDQTRRETESVLEEARAQAREILRDASAERERLKAEVNQIRGQLQAVLATIGGELRDVAPEPDETTQERVNPPASPASATPPPTRQAPPPAQPGPAQPRPAQPQPPASGPPRPAAPGGPPPAQAAAVAAVMNGVPQPVPR